MLWSFIRVYVVDIFLYSFLFIYSGFQICTVKSIDNPEKSKPLYFQILPFSYCLYFLILGLLFPLHTLCLLILLYMSVKFSHNYLIVSLTYFWETSSDYHVVDWFFLLLFYLSSQFCFNNSIFMFKNYVFPFKYSWFLIISYIYL